MNMDPNVASAGLRRGRWSLARLISILLAPCVAGCWHAIPGGADRASHTAASRARAAAPSGQGNRKEAAGGDVLKVGSERVSARDVWNSVRERALAVHAGSTVDAFRAFAERESMQWVTSKVAESLLFQRAMLRLGSDATKDLDPLIDQQVRKIVTAAHGGVQWRLEQHLASQGRTLADLRKQLRRELVIARFLELHIKPKVVEPTRAELVALHHGDQADLEGPERRSMSLIDVRILEQLPPGTAEPTRAQLSQAKEAAREKIESAREELLHGADFADVARRYSEGLHAADGGRWGWVGRGSVRERFEPAVEALYRLGPGDLSEVIETPYGFFLVRCDAVEGGARRDFESVQPELKERHFRREYNRLVAELLAELQHRARLEISDLTALRARVLELAVGDFAQTATDS